MGVPVRTVEKKGVCIVVYTPHPHRSAIESDGLIVRSPWRVRETRPLYGVWTTDKEDNSCTFKLASSLTFPLASKKASG